MAVDSGARPTSTLSGDFESRPLALLLGGASERGSSGTFNFRHEYRRATLTMRSGQVAVVRMAEPSARLGQVLVDLGAIDAPTLNATLEAVTSGQRLHGEVLLERGAVTRERLEAALLEQTLRKVEHLFTLPSETRWTFREDVDELMGARDEPRPAADAWQAIWRGLRRQPLTAHGQRMLAKADGGLQLKDLPFVDRFGLDADERAVCERLHARSSTLVEVLETSGLPPERTRVLVYLLAVSRCLVRIEVAPPRPSDLGVHGIRARARAVEGEDPYTTLGLRGGASREAARAAYLRLARIWHPDRLPPSLASVRPECERVFAQLSAAHRMLTESMRVEDVAIAANAVAANDSIAPAPPSFAPQRSLREADAALARGDLAAAEEIARQLVNTGLSGPGARAVLVWCGVAAGDANDRQALERALVALERIVTGDPDCVRALFFRGQVWKRLDRVDAAVRDFKKVARLDPQRTDALREVQLLEGRALALSSERPRVSSSDADAPVDPRTARERT
jgi:hypothetical protein